MNIENRIALLYLYLVAALHEDNDCNQISCSRFKPGVRKELSSPDAWVDFYIYFPFLQSLRDWLSREMG